MKKLSIITIIFLLISSGCQFDGGNNRIKKLQEKIDQISERLEQGEGLRAKEGTEDNRKSLQEIQKTLEEIKLKIEELNQKIDSLNIKYSEHLEEYHN